MRRLAAVAAFAMAVFALPGGGAQAQIPNDDHVYSRLEIYIVGEQFVARHFEQVGVQGGRVKGHPMLMGFLGLRTGAMRVGRGPGTYWLSTIRNLDPVEHHIWQCSSGPAGEIPEGCHFVLDTRIKALLPPMATCEGSKDDCALLRFNDLGSGKALILGCRIHPHMRAEIWKDSFDG